MSKLKIYIIEDELLFMNKMMMLVDKMGYDLAGSTDNSDTAFAEIPNLKPDLILADIGIRGTMDGIELVNKLNDTIKLNVIFVTAFSDRDTFERSKKFQPFAFITKPFNEEDLQRSIELALLQSTVSLENHTRIEENESLLNDSESFFVKAGKRFEKITIDDILYLEVESNYTSIFLDDGKKFVIKMSMDQLNDRIPGSGLVRTHRGYMVNIDKISSIDTQDMLVYLDNTHVPIGRAYKEQLLGILNML